MRRVIKIAIKITFCPFCLQKEPRVNEIYNLKKLLHYSFCTLMLNVSISGFKTCRFALLTLNFQYLSICTQ